MAKSNTEIASSIIDIDHRHNAGGLAPLKLYLGYIDGNPYKRTSAWWVEYKIITEGVKCKQKSLINKRVHAGWTEVEATSAKISESLRQYRQRINRNKKTNAETINNLFDLFNYRPLT